jgi:phage-related protein
MADGKITLEVEVDDSKLESETSSSAQSAGKKAGSELESGISKGAKSGASTAKSEVDGVGSAGKSAGSKIESGIETGIEQGAKSGASSASSTLESFGSKISGAFAALGVAAAASGIVDYLGECIEVANEYNEDMGKLQTAAIQTGVSNENMNQTYKDMVGILGETDQSVEAVNHLFQLCGDNTQQLGDWTNICAGIYATFGDSLPIEGLTEAANETAKVGQVTGPFADALNWVSQEAIANGVALSGNSEAIAAFNDGLAQGMSSEDAFNNALAACSDEQERAELITAAMSGAYSDAGDTYEEVNGKVIEYRKSQDDLKQAQAELGDAVMPLQTAFSNLAKDGLQLAADGLNSLMDGASGVWDAFSQFMYPIIENIITPLQNAYNDMMEDISPKIEELKQRIQDFYQEHQEVADAIGEVLGNVLPLVLEAFFGVVTMVVEGVILLIQGVITVWEGVAPIVQAACDLINWIFENILNPAIQAVQGLFQGLGDTVSQVFQGEGGMQPVIESVVTAIQGFFETILSPALDALSQSFTTFKDNLGIVWDEVSSKAGDTVNQLGNWLTQTVPDAINQLATRFSQLPGELAEYLSSIIGNVGSWAAQMVNKASQTGSSFVSGLVNRISSIPGSIAGILSSALSNISSWGYRAATTAASAAYSIGSRITSALWSIPSQMWSIGSNIVSGIWNGIVGGGSWIYSAVQNWAWGIVRSIKNRLGIHSPSRVMRDEVGKYMAEGVQVGFERNDPMSAIAASMKAGVSKVQMEASNSFSFEGLGNIQQVINFNQPTETPDQVARAMRSYAHYGLAHS